MSISASSRVAFLSSPAWRGYRGPCSRPAADEVDIEHRQLGDAGLSAGQRRLGDLVAGLEIDFAGLLVDQVLGEIAADQLLVAGQQWLRRPPPAGARPAASWLAGGELTSPLAASIRSAVSLPLNCSVANGVIQPFCRGERYLAVESGEDFLPRHADRFARLQRLALGAPPGPLVLARGVVEREQQRRRRQFAATVDPDIDEVLGVEFEMEPRAAIGMTRAASRNLPEECVLPLPWSKNTPGLRCSCETMTRSAPLMMKVPLLGHQRHVAHIDVLLLDVGDPARAVVLVDIPDAEAQGDLQRRGEDVTRCWHSSTSYFGVSSS